MNISLRSIKNILFLCTLCIVALSVTGCSISKRVARADKKFAIGEYYTAADIYKKCYSQLSPKKQRDMKAHVAFRQGECYRILNSPRAAQSYQNAIRLKYQDSIVYLRAAQALQYQGKYKEAIKHYETYMISHPDDYVARAGLYACKKVDEWKKDPSRYKVSLSKDFNYRKTANFAPCFAGEEGNVLVFTSNRQLTKGKKKTKRPSNITGQQVFQLFQTRKNAAGKWEEIKQPEGLYNEQAEEESETAQQSNDSTADKSSKGGAAEMGVCCFSPDGKTMYFTYSKAINGQDQGTKIMSSQRASGEWGEPQEVKLFHDSTISVAHPSMCPTGDTLYFVSDAPGGFGGKDIWFVELDGTEWGVPENMGPQINTTNDEMFPTVHADGSLYFSSNGHPGYGGLDIFHAIKDTTAKDSTKYLLYNMGTPLNSSGDDFAMTFEGNSQNGYFSSNRGDRKGTDQIYRFELPEMVFLLEGAITDNFGENLSDGALRLVGDDGTNTKVQVRRDGTFKIKLKKDVQYVMLATARGYLNQKQTVTTVGAKDSKTYHQDFQLASISKPVGVDNIFYEFAKWELTPESEGGLQALVKLLNDNPNITIELSAHTDMKGDEAFNKTLSEKRAQSVCNYLVAHGIARDRLSPVGYGKSKPQTADKQISEKYKFIPKGQVLDEAFILSLPEKQQEICNQINRRTEFKVLKTTYGMY
jgi:peptidoglycan-associated lipoprotein